jgi:hypothetical protein
MFVAINSDVHEPVRADTLQRIHNLSWRFPTGVSIAGVVALLDRDVPEVCNKIVSISYALQAQ